MALVVLAALGAALAVQGSQQARPPRLLGSLGSSRLGSGAATAAVPAAPGAQVRGVGRFARPRTALPNRL